jgi:hypothetical protein
MALTFNLPSQIVVQTAAQWAVDNTVYSNKRILVTSDVYYGSTDQRKFKIADGTQTWSNLDYMPIAQTLAQVLANDNKTNQIEIKSNNGYSQLNLLNAFSSFGWFGAKEGSVLANDDSLIVYHEDLVELNAPSITKNGDEILTSANITQTITNGVTDKAPSEDAVFDALALKANASLFKTNVNYAHTGTINETVLYSTGNLAGNFDVNDIFRILLNHSATSNANNKTIKIYLATASQSQAAVFNAASTTQLATYLTTTNGAMKRGLVRNVQFMNSLSSQQVVSTTTNGLDNDETALNSAGGLSTLSWNFATATYLIVTGTLASSVDTLNFLHFRGQIIR